MQVAKGSDRWYAYRVLELPWTKLYRLASDLGMGNLSDTRIGLAKRVITLGIGAKVKAYIDATEEVPQ